MPRILRNLKINEISGVDKGAGRGVRIMLMKRDNTDEIDWDVLKREFSSKERAAAADSGAALPDGSYPIKTKSDLKNAIQAIGRAKNPAKTKAHIKSRAKALGASDLIPDTWKRDVAALQALSQSIASIAADESIADKFAKVDESINQFNEFVSQESTDMTAEEIRKMLDEAVAKAVEPLHAEIEKLGGDGSKIKAKKPPPDADGDDDGDGDGPAKKWKKPTHDSTNNPGADANAQPSPGKSSNKRDDTQAETEIEKALSAERARTTELEKHLGVLLNERRQAEFRKRAVEAGLTENDGEIMRKAFDGDIEAQTEFTKRTAETIKAARAQVKTSVLFGQFGKSGQDAPASAYAEIEARAAELRKAEPKLSQHQAFAKVYSDPANSELVERDRTEQAQKRARLAAGM